MIRWLRAKLAHIRYHSATRPSGRWSRAVDLMPVVALLAAWPVAWLLDHSVAIRSSTEQVFGRIIQDDSGALIGEIVEDGDLRQNTGGRLICEFTADFETRAAGLPVHTSVISLPATMTLEIVGEALPRLNVKFDETRVLHVAVAETIDTLPPRGNVKHDIRRTERSRASLGWAWAGNIAVLWMLLTAIGIALVHTARLLTNAHKRGRYVRHKLRERENKCGHCGYDLTGLEFNERCPECGRLVHAPIPMPPS